MSMWINNLIKVFKIPSLPLFIFSFILCAIHICIVLLCYFAEWWSFSRILHSSIFIHLFPFSFVPMVFTWPSKLILMSSTKISSRRDRPIIMLRRSHLSFSMIIIESSLLLIICWHHLLYIVERIYIFQDAPVQFAYVAIFDGFLHWREELFVGQFILANVNLFSFASLFNQVFFKERNHVSFILRQHNSWNELQCPKLLVDVANVKFILQFFQWLFVYISPPNLFLVFFDAKYACYTISQLVPHCITQIVYKLFSVFNLANHEIHYFIPFWLLLAVCFLVKRRGSSWILKFIEAFYKSSIVYGGLQPLNDYNGEQKCNGHEPTSVWEGHLIRRNSPDCLLISIIHHYISWYVCILTPIGIWYLHCCRIFYPGVNIRSIPRHSIYGVIVKHNTILA